MDRLFKRGGNLINNYKIIAIILAAGSATRMKSKENKAFISVGGIPILSRTIKVFDEAEFVDEIIVVSKENEQLKIEKEIIKPYIENKNIKYVAGGKERQNSVWNALESIDVKEDVLVTIQDGARPFVEAKWILDSLKAAIDFDGGAVGIASKDTIKVIENGYIKETLERSKLVNIQTPQSFKLATIKEAYIKGFSENVKATDDSMLVERVGGRVKCIEGSYENIKITTPEDIFLAENILKGRK